MRSFLLPGSLLVFFAQLLACSSYEMIPCTTDKECKSGKCVQGRCVFSNDMDQEEKHEDLRPEEVTLEEVGDITFDEIFPEKDVVTDVSEEEPFTEIPEKRAETEDLPLDVGSRILEPCQTDDECPLGHCIQYLGESVCSGPCDPENAHCPQGFFCARTSPDFIHASYECVPFPEGICAKCTSQSDCGFEDRYCLMIPGESYCSISCATRDCPPGFECKNVGSGIPKQCLPTNRRCTCPPAIFGCDDLNPCDEGFDCVTLSGDGDVPNVVQLGCDPQKGRCACVPTNYRKTMPCVIENVFGLCAGEIQCTLNGFSVCSAYIPSQELCDGYDNDCDGETDEGFFYTDFDGSKKAVGEGCGTGVCAGGIVVCKDFVPVCTTEKLKLNREICGDGKDNNCDGETDEHCSSDDLDGDGSLNKDDCDPFDSKKHLGAFEPCCPSSVPPEKELEICDLNCDGQVQRCNINDKDGDGYVSNLAEGNDCDDNDPRVHPNAPEKCGDGIDQDCDGQDLSCSLVKDEDGDGFPSTVDCNDNDPNINPWAQEICNYIDDNCNGIIDEGNPGDGIYQGYEPCGSSIGECKQGIYVCAHYPPGNAKMECIGAVVPSEELCDGLDNDCDGFTDEDFPELGRPCDGGDMDQCKNGLFVCAPDGSGVACLQESRYDIVELCGDKIDNDCDGKTDDEDEDCLPEDLDGDGYLKPFDCDDTRAEVHPGAREPCCPVGLSGDEAIKQCDLNCDNQITYCDEDDKDGDGHKAKEAGGDDCDDNDPETYPGAPERCYSGTAPCDIYKDNDCDGQEIPCEQITDKDGDCFAPPFDCNDSNPRVHPFAKELCDNLDNNCDGVTDEGNPEGGEQCGTDEGECEHGITVCVHFRFNAWLRCVPKKGPSPEKCDGVDNNCNGLTDEWFLGLGEPCDGPDIDSCKNGRVVCKEDGSGTECSQETIENIVEVCDGRDNDCDGETDEDFTYDGRRVGEPCLAPGECGGGFVECSKDKKKAVCSSGPGGSYDRSTPEICDQKDNDCNGLIDDGVLYMGRPVGSLCLGIGACGVGIVECDYATGEATCSTNPNGSNHQNKPEVCNGLDDDCDGHIDEDVVPTKFDCKYLGVCADVSIPARCYRGQWVCDYSGVPNYQEEETWCDGLDNDCDGLTDEGYPVGEPCDGDDSDLCKNGTWTCKPDGSGVECVNETITNITEECNGIDDDCDELTDEDFPLGEPCDGEDSDLCKNGTWTCKEDGSGVECVNEKITNIQEECNGIDDDCDGFTDEGLRPSTQDCKHVGVCEGAEIGGWCSLGIWVCDYSKVPNYQDEETLCDGLDNDCDGLTDENLTYQGLPLGSSCVAPGECGAGIVVCSPVDKTATCSTLPNGTEPKSSPEVCDNKDNDCDGITDDDLTVDKSSCKLTGVCKPEFVQAQCVSGQWICDYSNVPNYEGEVERSCDGLDNDCDGLTDESFPVGQPCDGDDEDLCPNGVFTCNRTNDGVVCVGDIPVQEACNGVDDDCDGLIDEEGATGCIYFYYDGDQDSFGSNVIPPRCLCSPGQVPKFTTTLSGDCGDSDPFVYPQAPEKCNDKDDNCDGNTDENFPNKGGFCDGPDPDVCENGTWTCTADGNGLECVNDENRPEKCNGRDDDCDGLTDEDFPLGQPCDGNDSDLCKNGTWTCKADGSGVECVNETIQNIPERCDNKDNDCDGLIDEDWPDKGQVCFVGTGDCRRSGLLVCKADGSDLVCSATPGEPSTEICDGRDNDCNGVIDDPWISQKGKKCDQNPAPPGAPACPTGTWQCRPDGQAVQCVGEVECVRGDECLQSGSDTIPDSCQCGNDPSCTADVADQCLSGTCMCGTGQKCISPARCVAGQCI